MPELWPFDQAPDVAAITTRQVLDDGLGILNVTHYSDDQSGAFVCGTTDEESDGRVICMREAMEMDPTIQQSPTCLLGGVHGDARSAKLGGNIKMKRHNLAASGNGPVALLFHVGRFWCAAPEQQCSTHVAVR